MFSPVSLSHSLSLAATYVKAPTISGLLAGQASSDEAATHGSEIYIAGVFISLLLISYSFRGSLCPIANSTVIQVHFDSPCLPSGSRAGFNSISFFVQIIN